MGRRYENGCACGEKVEKHVNYVGDVRSLHDLGFDAVKLDGCGQQRNLTLYAQLMQVRGLLFSLSRSLALSLSRALSRSLALSHTLSRSPPKGLRQKLQH